MLRYQVGSSSKDMTIFYGICIRERAYQRRVGKHTKTFRVNLDRPVEIQRELESLGGIMKNVKYPAVVLLTEDSRVGDIAVTYGFMPANPIRKQD